MVIIGLCAPTGAGKSSVARIFEEKYDIIHIDCDKIAREVVKGNCLKELIDEYGSEILDESGALVRSRLAEIVFSSASKLDKLNKITHKYIIYEINEAIKEIAENNHFGACIDGAALFESGVDKTCDYIVTVIADKAVRLKRILKRDNISKESAELRINAQKNDTYYIEKANFIIINNTDFEALDVACSSVIESIMKKI